MSTANLTIKVNGKDAERDINRIDKSLDRLGKTSDTSGKKLAAFGKVAKIGLLAAAAAAFAAGKAALNASEEFDKIAKTADSIGLTTDALQSLRFAAEQSGVKTSELDKGMEFLVRSMGEATLGTGKLKDVMEEYDISLRNSNGEIKTAEELTLELADAYQNAGSDAEKALISTAAFGRAGVKMGNLMRDGADGVKALTDEAKNLGIVIDEDLLRQSEEWNDELNRLTSQLGAELKTALVQLMPIIIKLAEGLLAVVDATKAAWQAFKDLLGIKDARSELEIMNETLGTLKESYASLAEETSTLDMGTEQYRENIDQLYMLDDAIAELNTQIAGYGKTIETKVTPPVVAFTKATAEAEDALDAFGGAGRDIPEFGEWIKDVGDTTCETAKKTDECVGEMQGIWDNFMENVQGAWGDLFYDSMVSVLEDGKISFKDFTDTVLKMFIRMIADMAAKWAAAKIFGGGFSFGGLGASIGGIASSAAAGLGSLASSAASGIGSMLGFGTATTATTTAMGALAPVAEEATFASMQVGAASTTTTTAISGMSSALIGGGIVMAGFAINALAAAGRERRLKEATDEVTTAFNESTTAVTNANVAYTDTADGNLAVMLSDSAQQAGYLDIALNSVSDDLQRGYDGARWLKSGTEDAKLVMDAYTADAVSGLEAMIEAEKILNPEFRETADVVGTIGDAATKMTEEWAQGVELINETSFQPIIDEISRMTGITADDFQKIGADGVYTADEISASFGDSADDIIAAMGGASSITLTELLNILSVGDTTADGLAEAFKAAGYDMSGGMIDGVDKIQESIDGLTGAEIESTHTITTIRRGGGADESDSFASGTGGYLDVPYTGYQPTLHKGEKFNVKKAGEVSNENASQERTNLILNQQLSQSEAQTKQLAIMNQRLRLVESAVRSG